MPKVSVGRAELDTRPHILYRFYDRTGVLLYVGITVDFASRMATHAKEKDWWCRVDRSATRVDYYDTRRAALDAEREAIKTEKPLENDQHNEWVDVEDGEDEESKDPLLDFAIDALSWLDEHERSPLLEKASTDWDGNPVSERERDIEAARAAVVLLWRARKDLAGLMNHWLDLMSDCKGADYLALAREDHYAATADDRYPEIPENVLAGRAFKLALYDRASEILGSLPLDEAREWIAAGQTLGIKSSVEQKIFGARYALLFKEQYVSFGMLCDGPGRSGARCTRKSDYQTFFEVCQKCRPNTSCTGHAFWCEEHSKEAAEGRLSMIPENPAALWPISHIEPVPSSPWAAL